MSSDTGSNETSEEVECYNNCSMQSVEDEGNGRGTMIKSEEENFAFYEDSARASDALGLMTPSSPDKPYSYMPVRFSGALGCKVSKCLLLFVQYTKQTSELPSLVEKVTVVTTLIVLVLCVELFQDEIESFELKEPMASPAICQDTNPPAEDFKSELHQLLRKSTPVKRQRVRLHSAASFITSCRFSSSLSCHISFQMMRHWIGKPSTTNQRKK